MPTRLCQALEWADEMFSKLPLLKSVAGCLLLLASTSSMEELQQSAEEEETRIGEQQEYHDQVSVAGNVAAQKHFRQQLRAH